MTRKKTTNNYAIKFEFGKLCDDEWQAFAINCHFVGDELIMQPIMVIGVLSLSLSHTYNECVVNVVSREGAQ